MSHVTALVSASYYHCMHPGCMCSFRSVSVCVPSQWWRRNSCELEFIVSCCVVHFILYCITYCALMPMQVACSRHSVSTVVNMYLDYKLDMYVICTCLGYNGIYTTYACTRTHAHTHMYMHVYTSKAPECSLMEFIMPDRLMLPTQSLFFFFFHFCPFVAYKAVLYGYAVIFLHDSFTNQHAYDVCATC